MYESNGESDAIHMTLYSTSADIIVDPRDAMLSELGLLPQQTDKSGGFLSENLFDR